eukprot:6173725-Pleurochrysis_carterae.AAC.8
MDIAVAQGELDNKSFGRIGQQSRNHRRRHSGGAAAARRLRAPLGTPSPHDAERSEEEATDGA